MNKIVLYYKSFLLIKNLSHAEINNMYHYYQKLKNYIYYNKLY